RIWSLGVQTRRLLIVVSVLGAAASMFAVLRGAWLLALALYGASIAVLCLLLWCASARTGGRTEPAEHRQAAGGDAAKRHQYGGAARIRRSDGIDGAADCG